MNSSVSRQFIASTEPFHTSGEVTRVRLLTCMNSHVSRLIFQSLAKLYDSRTSMWSWRLCTSAATLDLLLLSFNSDPSSTLDTCVIGYGVLHGRW